MVKSNLKKSDLTCRKLKLSDYYQFRKLFKSCFKRNISFNFFKWRYFSNRESFCYGVFKQRTLIANVGMFSIKLNNKEKIYSRHSSMVKNSYRGIGLFSDLLRIVKKKVIKKTKLLVMWPNKNNYANFGINRENIIKKNIIFIKQN